jgi:hypothetical protein
MDKENPQQIFKRRLHVHIFAREIGLDDDNANQAKCHQQLGQ